VYRDQQTAPMMNENSSDQHGYTNGHDKKKVFIKSNEKNKERNLI
jgi:hypothetical protein